MFRAIRRSLPADPKYPIIAARSRASCRCTLTFQDRNDAFENRGSTVIGASPRDWVAEIAFPSGIGPVAPIGFAKGGLPAVSRTTVVLGWSTALPNAARTTVRGSADGVQATPSRGSTFELFC